MCFLTVPQTRESRTEYTDYVKCENCQINVPKKEYRFHLRTNLHKFNSKLNSEYEYIDIIATAFKNRIISYRVNPSQEFLDPEAFLMASKEIVMKVINNNLIKHGAIKLNFELFAHFIQPKSYKQQMKSFNTKYEIVYQSTDISSLFSNVVNTFERKISELELCESGWSYLSMSHLEININKYCPLRGGSYIDLPSVIKNSKSCINIKNNDNHCFLWCIVASLFPQTRNVCRTSSYPHYTSVLNVNGVNIVTCSTSRDNDAGLSCGIG